MRLRFGVCPKHAYSTVEAHSITTMRSAMFRRIIISIFVLSFAMSLGACGDTWRGVKKDTGENMQKTGGAIEKAGENVKK